MLKSLFPWLSFGLLAWASPLSGVTQRLLALPPIIEAPKVEVGWADPRALGGRFIDVGLPIASDNSAQISILTVYHTEIRRTAKHHHIQSV